MLNHVSTSLKVSEDLTILVLCVVRTAQWAKGEEGLLCARPAFSVCQSSPLSRVPPPAYLGWLVGFHRS